MAKIPRAFLLSATSSSAPFLYQTRTLAPLSQSLCRCPPINRLQRQYSGSNIPENDDGYKDGSNENNSGPKISSETSTSPATNDCPAPRRSFLRRRAEEVAPKTEPTEPAPSSRPLQTITPAEKMIFADLLKQLKKEKPAATTTKPSRASARRPKPENVNDLIALFDDIFDKSEKEAAEKKRKQEKEKEKAASAARGDTQEKSFDIPGGSDKIRYSDLRFSAIASKAHPDFEITITDAVDLVIKRESKRIEDELFKAIEEGRGDMGLWEECQEHIFGMLQHLEEPTPTVSDAVADDSSSGTMNGTERPMISSGPLNIPAMVPVTPVLAKLYPKTLLVAFRLLNTHFPESQLIGQFRSTIKNQGRTSSVLGTSSALCDEMIYFHWHGCNDLPAVIGFLHDMDLHGLSPSPKSHRLLKEIVRQRFRDLDSVRQSDTGVASFWQFPPNQTAFQELSGPGGWLDRLDEHARRESAIPFTSE
ncbi:hypothetical protein N7448_004708 [Penicillium atrosanguineum]|uniref:Mtf2-like C-terminal domain-containing protein n=1 Tax=Penicillium atrosanguineum TaxID=1132637 RepID=A0A9W9L4W7_9EURO|nr:uncharacterized protein N7443_008457 [Penicillium atrosanguineum]KAJ5125386.1 hypothetical protein N7526_007563 [Penicillium atrosanguineum]KAJ5136154.1 hypothetical protein N7448_004708 [Penicillium atrosanguineum]KAJ5292504.1 hypothetical protein N7443_008457 [Penicillium atrosanguineum]KAJ5303473.1 hypothetical protein N7476_010272 [Penicillium atrosanguineum]